MSYSAMKIFDSLPNNVKNFGNDMVHFKIVLCKYLIYHHFSYLQNSLNNIEVVHVIGIWNF
jgi:hypothetical protein